MALFQYRLAFFAGEAYIYVYKCGYQLGLVFCVGWNVPTEPLLLGRIFITFDLSGAINQGSEDKEDLRGWQKYEQNVGHMAKELYAFDSQFLVHIHQDKVKLLDPEFAQIFVMQLLLNDR